MPQTITDAETRAALIALISATAGSPTGVRMCRRLLKTAVAVVLDEPDDLPPAGSIAAAQAAGELAALLSMAAEHAEALAGHADAFTPRPPHLHQRQTVG